MTLQKFIHSYRIATGGDYDFRLEEARLFVTFGQMLQRFMMYVSLTFKM